jgi:hypothetical protein
VKAWLPVSMPVLPVLAAVSISLVALSACGDNQTTQEHANYEGGAPAPLACAPNLDGKIEAKELQAAIGIPLSYLFSPSGKSRTVDLAGKPDAQGHLTWDMAVDYADDQVVHTQASPIKGKWYAASFPDSAFVVPSDAAARVEGVYVYDTAGYHLLGLASFIEAPPEGKTLYVYDAPVDIFRFPLAPGLTYTSTGNVKNATLRGLPYAGTDTYVINVDGSGILTLTDITFSQALRVRTTLTATPVAGKAVTTRQTSFLFECFGEVARATSQTDETQDNFTTAAEVRRLGLLP